MYERNEETGQIDFRPQPVLDAPGWARGVEQQGSSELRRTTTTSSARGGTLLGGDPHHRPDIIYNAFVIAGYSAEEVLGGVSAGMPTPQITALPPPWRLGSRHRPHRPCCLADTPNLREVVALRLDEPQAQDLLKHAPAPVRARAEDLHIRWICRRLELPEV